MKKHFSFFYFFPIIAVFLFSCGTTPANKNQQNKRPVAPPVEGFIIKPRSLTQIISVSGTVKPFEETVLMPEVSGRVVTLNLPEGKPIAQGTLLVKLFDGDLQAQLEKSKALLELAKLNEKRNAELLKSSAISQADFDQTAIQVRSSEADIDLIKAQIRKTEITAPYDGILGLRMISPGAQVTPQTPVATFRSEKRLKVDFSVPGKYSGFVKTGMTLKLRVQGTETACDATVIATEEAIDVGTRNLKVRALFNNPSEAIKPGSFADVDFELGESSGALLIPTQAIIPRERDKQVIVTSGGKAKFIPVTTGVRQDSLVQILTGLHPGDTIATTGLLFLKPGADVKLSRVTQ